jgi:plastocyanin
MIDPGITMPDYITQEEINADFPLPQTYSGTVPFEGSGLSVGRLDGEPFLISYTIHATVHPAETMDNVESARANQTEIPAANITIVSGSAFLNDTAYSPNPINVTEGDTVTWVNVDFDPHTITSGTFGGDDAGDEFDSGYMGPQASFSHTFEDTGEFEYFCALHPNMVGTVIVSKGKITTKTMAAAKSPSISFIFACCSLHHLADGIHLFILFRRFCRTAFAPNHVTLQRAKAPYCR